MALALRPAAPLVLALALLLAACGSTPTSQPTPKSSPTSKTTPATKGLTLAQATASGYIAKFPLVSCSTLSASAQAAWTPLLAGSQVNKCAPANFLVQDVPQSGVKVTNNDPSISQAQANAYGRALLATFGWEDWAVYADAPQVLANLPLYEGPLASIYQLLEGGGKLTTPIPGIAVYPNQITLVPLSTADQTIMANTTDKFALVLSFKQGTYSYTYTYPSATPPFPLTGKSTSNDPEIFTGSLTSNSIMGTYLKVHAFDLNCTSDAAAGICQAGGAS